MSGKESRTIKCGDCGADLPSEWAGSVHRPCSECGSIHRVVTLTTHEGVQIRECMEGRIKDPTFNSKKNPRVKFKVGASYSRARKKWMHREMYVDKRQDQYREVVSDPDTGEVIHQCEEPLSKHQSHGDARPGRSTNKETASRSSSSVPVVRRENNGRSARGSAGGLRRANRSGSP